MPRHALTFDKRSGDGSGKCMLSTSGQGVHVAVYELSVADKRILDEIEGVGRGYSHGIVDIPGFSDCATYFAEATHIDESLPPYDWYREIVLTGCRYQAFPEDYIAAIAGVEAIPDPDPERSRRHWALVERLNGQA